MIPNNSQAIRLYILLVNQALHTMIALNPRAPVCLSIACFAIACRASDVNDNSTWSMPNKARYCGTKAFFGSVNILTSISTSNEWNGTKTGNRPTNSYVEKEDHVKSSMSRMLVRLSYRNHSELNQVSCLNLFKVCVTLSLVVVHGSCTGLSCTTSFR